MIVVVESVVPSQDVPGAGLVSDKLMHLLDYAVLGALATLGMLVVLAVDALLRRRA